MRYASQINWLLVLVILLACDQANRTEDDRNSAADGSGITQSVESDSESATEIPQTAGSSEEVDSFEQPTESVQEQITPAGEPTEAKPAPIEVICFTPPQGEGSYYPVE